MLIAGLALFAAAAPAVASDNPAMDAAVKRINDQWAHIRYEVPNREDQYRQLSALEGQAAQVAARYPGRAEPLLWEGIVVSKEAARATLLKQLGLATRARDILGQAYTINPKVADGGAAMSLGVLYYRVPGFPIGFGSTKRARTYFQQALVQEPTGLDNNFFYGDFLHSTGNDKGARLPPARAEGTRRSEAAGVGRGSPRRDPRPPRQDRQRWLIAPRSPASSRGRAGGRAPSSRRRWTSPIAGRWPHPSPRSRRDRGSMCWTSAAARAGRPHRSRGRARA
jgi:tetratricopeptide (TPR) repeat protein